MSGYINIHTHSTDLNGSPDEVELPNVIIGRDPILKGRYSAGIHPWYIDQVPSGQLDALRTQVRSKALAAIGECGLDKRCDTDWELQQEVFEQQVQLAQDCGKPVIIHCVKAYSEVMHVLQKHDIQVPVIFHGFTKGIALARQLIRSGYYLSLGHRMLPGVQDELIRWMPLEFLFLETDHAPVSIAEIYAYFCGVRGLESGILQEQIAYNFSRVFNQV